MKRLMDVIVAGVGLVCAAPVLAPVMVIVWWQDGHSPLYVAPRVGQHDRDFRMVKLRSMVVNADKVGVDSTGANDQGASPPSAVSFGATSSMRLRSCGTS